MPSKEKEAEAGRKSARTKKAQYGGNDGTRAKLRADWTAKHGQSTENPYTHQNYYNVFELEAAKEFDDWRKAHPGLDHLENPFCHPDYIKEFGQLTQAAPAGLPDELALNDHGRQIARLARLIITRVKKGGELSTRVNPQRTSPNFSDLCTLLLNKWQQGRCSLCGGKFTTKGNNRMLQLSCDRVDSENEAYDEQNAQLTHLACNLAKNKYGRDAFEGWLEIVRNDEGGRIVHGDGEQKGLEHVMPACKALSEN